MSARTVTAETCVPPPEHAEDRSLHLLRNVWSEDPRPFEWTLGRWFTPRTGFGTKPAQMYVLGWRYVAPCVPPPASEGEG